MPRISPTGGNHINLSVSDLDRSVAWYCRVLGLVVIAGEQDVPPATDRPLRYRSLASPQTMSYVIGLIEHAGGTAEPFDERRPGLDHFALHVPESADLADWAEHLSRLGVEHSGIKTVAYGAAITFRDPDNIQLELHLPNLGFWAARMQDVGAGSPPRSL